LQVRVLSGALDFRRGGATHVIIYPAGDRHSQRRGDQLQEHVTSTLPTEIAGRYSVERELGRGGTAVVYLARDLVTGKMVALKVLRTELSESLSSERFLREIRVTQQLSHPNIAPVLESGAAGATLYCVLEYMDGGTLRARLERERQLPLSDVSAIAADIGAALEYAHGQKIIHRDVKPENILFGDGRAWLADFGIARALENAGDGTTSTGIVRGTPAYMSPEQASGERDYDGRSDMYSFACVLYEAIAGMPAFVGPNVQAVLAQRLVHVPRPLGVYRPAVSTELEAVLARALAVAPADRYQTAAEFTRAFRSAIETPSSTFATAHANAPSRRRHRRLWAAGVAVVAGIGFILGPLHGRAPWAANVVLDTTTASVAAGTAWQHARQSLSVWNLDEADSGFAQALRADSNFDRAALWLALVRGWSGASTSLRGSALKLATRRSGHLSPLESHIAVALQAQADGAWDRACPAWRAITIANRSDAIGWFGVANCLRQDVAVIPDKKSPSGWRFRASAQELVQAYYRAFDTHPITEATGRTDWLPQVWTWFYIRIGQVRSGTATPGGTAMTASPGWEDTLAFVPYPETDWRAGVSATQSTTREQALIHQRRLLNELATSWVAVAPSSAPALETLAFSLSLLDDPGALDTLRRARSLARTESERVRLAAAEVWFRFMHAFPDDVAGLREAQVLADSLVATPSVANAAALQGVAALLGHARLAARLSGQVDTGSGGPTVRSLARDGPALLTFAAFGGPVDSLRHLETIVANAIDATVLAEERARIGPAWLERPARIVFPDDTFASFRRLAGQGDELLAAQWAVSHGAPDSAQRYRDSRAALRRRSAAANVPPEAIFPEARLFLLTGDTTGAIRWLDPMLGAVRQMDPQVLALPVNAAALLRATALRADLAARAGDAAAAARWAQVVALLWRRADDFLQPTVRRMDQLARMPNPEPKRH
jgi:tRNA A-37 threonylcarbamoyl transferase component Bud32